MAMTRAALIEYVKRKLGAPIIKVELEDCQIEDNINDALIMYRDWSSDGTHTSHYVMDGIEAQALYQLPAEIREVREAMTMSFSRALTSNIVDPYLNIFGPANQGYSLVEIGTEYLSDIQRMFETIMRYDTFRDEDDVFWIEFTPDPLRDQKIALMVEKEIDERALLGKIWVKNYVVALSKLSLGEVREKFTQLAGPNGPQLNGPQLKAEAITEIDKLKDNLQTQHREPIGFITG